MVGSGTPKKKPRKIRGCYNCSQRRINCDRETPMCRKCVGKGLECFGWATRYRILDGVASRGRLAGMKIPVRDVGYYSPSSSDQTAVSLPVNSPPQSTLMKRARHNPCHYTPSQSLENIDSRSRFLLQYFSDKVAPAMVAVVALNGYRDFILPLSEQDEIVQNAVMAASAHHLSFHCSEWKSLATKYHMAAIRGLSQRNETHKHKSVVYSNLSAMLLLLIEEMITGNNSKDYQILLRMVKSFANSQGGENTIEKTALGRFLMQQMRKMSLYSQPLICQEMAQQKLANISKKDLSFLYSILDSHPEHSPIVLKLINLITKACNIYMARAANSSEQKIQDLVRDFINETASFNARSLGGHILIWPFFILGTECSQDRDRAFVIDQLQYLWEWTGFASTLHAIDTLKQFWSDGIGSGWIQSLVKQVDVFIM